MAAIRSGNRVRRLRIRATLLVNSQRRSNRGREEYMPTYSICVKPVVTSSSTSSPLSHRAWKSARRAARRVEGLIGTGGGVIFKGSGF